MLCMNQRQLARTTPWVGHLLSEHYTQTGGSPSPPRLCIELHHGDEVINRSSWIFHRMETRYITRMFTDTLFVFLAHTLSQAHIC